MTISDLAPGAAPTAHHIQKGKAVALPVQALWVNLLLDPNLRIGLINRPGYIHCPFLLSLPGHN